MRLVNEEFLSNICKSQMCGLKVQTDRCRNSHCRSRVVLLSRDCSMKGRFGLQAMVFGVTS